MSEKQVFELLDHCCRVCGGRLLQREVGETVQFRCAECGTAAEGAKGKRAGYASLCFCGVRLASGADAGLRCRRSERITPERPQEVVVRQEPQEGGRRRPAPRPVKVPLDD